MFSDQYEFFIDDFEKKLGLLNNKEDKIKVIRGDLKNFINGMFINLGRCINFREIEIQLGDLQKIDIATIANAAKLFSKDEFFNASFTFGNGKQINFKEVFDSLSKQLDAMQQDEVQLGTTEVLFRLEMFINSSFERMIVILRERAPIRELHAMVLKKLENLAEGDIKILWSRVKEEFREPEYGFEYNKEILGEDFFKVKEIGELRDKIAKYVTDFRPKIISERLKIGKTTSPIFSFGIARMLGIYKSYAKDLTLNEVAFIKIINRILEFWNELLCGEKEDLCMLLGISSEGRIASLKARDLDHDLSGSWADFKNDSIRSYQLILCELRRLLKIINYYITRQTDVEKALFQYKLKYEIFAKENNKTFNDKGAPNELFLQKELCAYLLEKNIYSYGKSFGSYKIDLMIDQPGEVYILETKIYRGIIKLRTLEHRIYRNFIQLDEYLDKELNSPYGILIIYNITNILIKTPKNWLRKRLFILPINISEVTPSKRQQSITIEESEEKGTIRFISDDSDWKPIK
ncbi:MAG: hypothetical protein ISS47_09935 [Candidatus Omnitrophica bacterium]|nr:hypothetical protein [Candidatus Omnitrophota bacterium]